MRNAVCGRDEGRHVLSEVALGCLWLLRRELRAVARRDGDCEELRHVLRHRLAEVSLPSLQALFYASTAPQLLEQGTPLRSRPKVAVPLRLA